MTSVQTASLTTPDGVFTVLAGPDAVLASGWTADAAALAALVHPVLRPTPAEVAAAVERAGAANTESDAGTGTAAAAGSVLAAALSAVEAYYAGDLYAPAAVPVQQRSGEFRQHAWEVLRLVPPGDPITYTEYAKRADRPTAVRAAAAACARNAAALFVPCHRVLRTDGTLGGFRYGLEIKQRLLLREAAAPA